MTEKVIAARNSLHSALDNYIGTCLDSGQLFLDRTIHEDVAQELTNTILGELELFSSYHHKLLEAKAALLSARNLSPHVVPVSRLPIDVLAHIFQLVTSESSNNSSNQNYLGKYSVPKYPKVLAHVCSHWRRVATIAKDIWAYINIPSNHFRDEKVLTYIEGHIARSGGWPLDVQITESEIGNHPETGHSLVRLLSPISTRTQSLDLRLGKPRPPIMFSPFRPPRTSYSSVLNTCFSNCKAGMLTRLAINLEDMFHRFGRYFIVPAGSGSSYNAFQPLEVNLVPISIPEHVFEKLLLPITVLDLKGCYPRWTSKAYHGLVELRLGTGASISERELHAILLSSPKLRVFEFGLNITQLSPPDRLLTPVSLIELERLVAITSNLGELAHFLRLIRPGSYPLGVSINKSLRYNTPQVSIGLLPISQFFAGANLQMLSITGYYNHLQVTRLLKLVPHIRALVLTGMDLSRFNPNNYKATASENAGPQVNNLYILHRTTISRELLLWMVRTYRVHKLIFAKGSKITRINGNVRDKQPLVTDLSILGCMFQSVVPDASYPIWH